MLFIYLFITVISDDCTLYKFVLKKILKKLKKKKKEKHYFERVNILFFDMVSNGISLFFKKFLIFTRVATL